MLVGCLAVLACSGGDDSAPDDGLGPGEKFEAELFESTRVLDASTLQALTADADDLVLRFAGTPEQLRDIEAREVLLAGDSETTPRGLMRLVTAVEREGDDLVLRTVQAPLQLAFKRLSVRLEREIEPGPEPLTFDGRSWGPGVHPLATNGGEFRTQNLDFYPFNGDGDTSTTDDQVHVSGRLGGGFDFWLGIDFDWDVLDTLDSAKDCVLSGFQECSLEDLLPEAKIGYGVKAGAEASLAIEGVAFREYAKDFSIGKPIQLPKITLGFLVFFPEIEILAAIEGRASSRFVINSSLTSSFESEASLSTKHGGTWIPPTLTPPKLEAPSVDAVLSASAGAQAGARLHVRLYDLFGPYATIWAFAEIDAEYGRSPCWEVSGGLKGDFGFDIVLDLKVAMVELADFSEEFEVAEKVLASGNCSAKEPPKPAEQAFSDPDFTPWANSYSNTLHTYPFEERSAQAEWTQLTPTIDGKFVISGSAVEALTKIGPSGDLVWAYKYAWPDEWSDVAGVQREILLGNVVNAPDASMLVTAFPYVAQAASGRRSQLGRALRSPLRRKLATLHRCHGGKRRHRRRRQRR